MAKSKKDLDKDLMFKKILPSLIDNPFSANAALGTYAEPEEPAEAVLRNQLFGRSLEACDNKTIATVNIMESLVLRHLDSAIQRFNACKCDRCRCDVAALALNHLPPKYVVTSPGRIAACESEVPLNLVMDALIKAVIQVRSKPRH